MLSLKFLITVILMEKIIKEDLALAYQILAKLGFDDHTYTHLSARVDGAQNYYIYPFGYRFEEVNADILLKVSLDGNIISGQEKHYNKTGYVIHSSIYKVRSDINAIFHIHTPNNVAVASSKDGLLPISQWALHFYDRISYHNYNSLVLNIEEEGKNLVENLKKNYVMMLRNHGVITCGRKIQEAMFYTYHLEQACRTQCLLQQNISNIVIPSREICQKSVQDLLNFEEDLGKRDWEAWVRVIKK